MVGFVAGKKAEDMSQMRPSNIITNTLNQLDQMFGELLLGHLCIVVTCLYIMVDPTECGQLPLLTAGSLSLITLCVFVSENLWQVRMKHS